MHAAWAMYMYDLVYDQLVCSRVGTDINRATSEVYNVTTSELFRARSIILVLQYILQ
jgi:hypothetical protein